MVLHCGGLAGMRPNVRRHHDRTLTNMAANEGIHSVALMMLEAIGYLRAAVSVSAAWPSLFVNIQRKRIASQPIADAGRGGRCRCYELA
jgi:hypothetical protein